MAFSHRLRIIVPGGALVAALGLGAACMSLAAFFTAPESKTMVLFIGSVLLAPLFFLLPWMRVWAGASFSVPTETVAVAAFAIVAVPFHPILGRRWAAGVTILGLIAWLVCEMIVAGAPA
jgi:hypothetical protein